MLTALPRRQSRAKSSRRRWTLALALFSATISAAVHAESALPLEEALLLAQERSRQLAGHDASAQASRQMAIAAGQRPDPALKAGINNLPIDGADRFSLTRDFMTMRSVGVMQEFTRRDKLNARTARFDREGDAAEAARLVTLIGLRRDTARAWLDRHYQERIREILLAQRAEASLQVEAADTGYRGGGGSQADVFSARSAVAQIDDRIRDTNRQILTTTTTLARWIGKDASRPLAPVLPDVATVRLDLQGLESQLAHHPQIGLMLKQEQVALAEVDVARQNMRADWSVELMYNQRGPAFSNMVSLNFSVPLQLDQRNRQDRELAAKLATAEQMRAEREEATREHVAQARGWLQHWQSNLDRSSDYDRSLIPLAEERTRAAIAAYRGGKVPLNAVLEARRVEIDTRLERIRLDMETSGLWAQLTYLIPPEHEVTPPNNFSARPER